ncbi:phosphotransferase [Xylogone sp. PMI_703]|nr:phosphotransferase [Xylogone sp. PMI_703]
MYDGKEELDNLVWDKNDEDYDRAEKQMRLTTTCRKVEDLVREKLGHTATLISPLFIGGFNVFLVPFPAEKTLQEAATAALIAKQTQLPVPRPLLYGESSKVGPFVIMEYIENYGSVSARLTTPSEDDSTPHVLNPDIPETTLEAIWRKIADCLLQLCRMTFPRIGSLLEVGEGVYEVSGRPITHNMTDMIRLANIPPIVLPPKNKMYQTADEWYTALADMHIAQLIFQHNDAITSEDDCRNKYVARQIFRRLARQGRLSTFGFSEDTWSAQSSSILPSTLSPMPPNSDSFRIWGDDFRAGNVLLTESDDIAALVDWEYTYVGPTQFALDPPWWLLLENAEMWSAGIDDWRRTHEFRLKTWLSAMRKAEADTAEPNPFPAALSTYMQESWETGRFFLNYGARKSWAFDAMYWRFLDERFYGDRGDIGKDDLWKTRIHLLSEKERVAMEPFVERKMAESKTRCIVDWDPTEAQEHFSELLFG